MNNKIVLFGLLIMFAGVMADLPSCYVPPYDSFRANFDFADDLNLTSTYTGGTYDVIDQMPLPADVQTRLGLTGKTIRVALHYQDASNNRGLAYFANDSTYFYAIFQWNNDVFGIPYLMFNGESAYPAYCNGIECIYVNETAGNESMAKFFRIRTKTACTAIATTTIWWDTQGLLFNLTSMSFPIGIRESCYVWGGRGLLNIEGYSAYIGSVGGANCGATCGGNGCPTLTGTTAYHKGFWNYTTIANGDFLDTFTQTCDVWAETFMNYTYFGCGSQVGAKTVTAWAGSETCNNLETLTQITCTFQGPTGSEDCTISAGSNASTSTSTLKPSYRDAEVWGEWMYIDSPTEYGGQSCQSHSGQTGRERLIVTKPMINSRETNYMMIDFNDPDDWINEFILGFGAESARTITNDIWTFNVLRLNSPTGDIGDVPIATLNFDTDHQNTGLPCESDDYYNATFILGVNSTWWKSAWLTCWGGTTSLGSKYANTTAGLTELMSTAEQQRITGCSGWLVADYAVPVWKDETGNTINRFSYAFFNVSNGSVPVYSFMVDDTHYEMNYTFIDYEPQTCQLTDNPFGNYSYACESIDGYFTEDNLSGIFELNATDPLFAVTLKFQRKQDLYLNITITQDGMDLENIICASDYGVSSTSGGVCSIFLGENPNINVSVRFPNLPDYPNEEITFPIGDYYNSEGYGKGAKCIDFTGYYEYSFDVRDVRKSIRVHAVSEQNTKLGGATIYLDGEPVCTTSVTGQCAFLFDLDFVLHGLVAEKNSYYNGTWYGTLYDNPSVTIKLSSRTGAGDVGDVQDSTGFLGLVKNKGVMSLLLVAGGATAGAGFAGVPGAVAIGMIMAVLCTLLGWLDWYVMVFLVVALALIGASSIRELLSGK